MMTLASFGTVAFIGAYRNDPSRGAQLCKSRGCHELGRDAFHRVRNLRRKKTDAVERVPTEFMGAEFSIGPLWENVYKRLMKSSQQAEIAS